MTIRNKTLACNYCEEAVFGYNHTDDDPSLTISDYETLSVHLSNCDDVNTDLLPDTSDPHAWLEHLANCNPNCFSTHFTQFQTTVTQE